MSAPARPRRAPRAGADELRADDALSGDDVTGPAGAGPRAPAGAARRTGTGAAARTQPLPLHRGRRRLVLARPAALVVRRLVALARPARGADLGVVRPRHDGRLRRTGKATRRRRRDRVLRADPGFHRTGPGRAPADCRHPAGLGDACTTRLGAYLHPGRARRAGELPGAGTARISRGDRRAIRPRRVGRPLARRPPERFRADVVWRGRETS